VIVVRGDEVLFGLRRGAHGGGTWSFPGGHVDDGESAEACALHELEEEAGLRAVNPRRVGESEDVFRRACTTGRSSPASNGPAVRRPCASRRPAGAGVGSPGRPRLSRSSSRFPACALRGFVHERAVGARAGDAPA
jgi:8-oxo-dGTP pyrophosphatase MutT (NUDIX family)